MRQHEYSQATRWLVIYKEIEVHVDVKRYLNLQAQLSQSTDAGNDSSAIIDFDNTFTAFYSVIVIHSASKIESFHEASEGKALLLMCKLSPDNFLNEPLHVCHI
ncbi:uncharacterized protein PHALS_02676 [Plasmopara halstedii]|uniref:Uncharacterized protein n=1 Tax=Plasmopara halstedii TaxID=4781 RepID=A0A0P1AW91_PLAHL|nr:uncharacterized protein PHALS_02676 [Plasmopara halstedii]CEG46265.1 hypothetical protein PHALS_02676 [Plasmopara halstedii]|eukprot:XP_024582634.1 hypothetical protein PHALS_02676 [Plasmopara halstedii]